MEEVCVLKTCGRISLVLSTLTTNSLMLLFWTFAGVHVWPRCFLCVRSFGEYFTKFIPSQFFSFFPIWFFKVVLAQGSKWKKCLYKFM